MKGVLKKTLWFLVRFSPVLFIVGPAFFAKGYLFFTDFVWGPQAATLSSWASSAFLTSVAIKGLSFVLSVDVIEKLYITVCLGLALWGGRKIAGLFLKNQWLVFIVSLFALFNPFVYDRAMYGQFGIVAAFGLMLLGAGFLLEYLEKKQARQAVFAGLGFAFSIQCSPHFIFFISAFYLFVFLPGFFIGKGEAATDVGGVARDSAKQKIFTAIKISLILLVIAFVLNANWIVGGVTGTSALGQFVSTGITQQDLVAFQTSGKTGADALGNVLMMSGFWGKDQFRYQDLTTIADNWGRSFFLLLPLILWGFVAALRAREKKYRVMTIGAGALFVVSIILAAGIRIPVGSQITYFLFNHLPFYKGLRESQKWVSVATMIYLIFLSVGLRELFATKIVQRNALIMKILVGAIIVMEAPLLLWGFGGQVRPVQYPSDWYTVNSYIVHDDADCSGSILFFPWHEYMSFSWIGAIVANPAPAFFQCPVISGTDMEWGGDIIGASEDSKGQAVVAWLNAGGMTDLLHAYNIRYIVLAKELDWQSYIGMGTNPELQPIMETATLVVYKVIK
ncbi:MAG: hypothetical protein ABR884_02530 [Minisyncoccia bacterium]